jgi:hypothetical protein
LEGGDVAADLLGHDPQLLQSSLVNDEPVNHDFLRVVGKRKEPELSGGSG